MVRPLGAFPEGGPLTYLPLTASEVRSALRGDYPKPRVWYHATLQAHVPSICQFGLVPSCWYGGDSCCIFGADERWEAAARGTGWVIEIESASSVGQLKAWWVPAGALRGAWHQDHFYARRELALGAARPPPVGDGCQCDLSALVKEEIRRWRMSWGHCEHD